jgi:hypothetical protein
MANQLGALFGIGGQVSTGAGSTVSWGSATPIQRLGSILSSRGVANIAAVLGPTAMMAGLRRGGLTGGLMSVLGGAAGGYGLAKSLGLNPLGGAAAGAGIGLIGTGWKTGGAGGLALDVLGGFTAGAGIGMMIGGPFGAAIGAFAGTLVGAGIGIARLFVSTRDEQLRKLIKQTYGIDVSDAKIRQQILQLADQKYGGSISMAVYSSEVQDLLRLYALSTGQRQSGLPRPMYGVTMAQSAAGGLQTQPVYSGGQLVESPYTGTTTTQLQNALFLQLHPQQAMDLFSGQVVQVLGQNPGAVASANTSAARSGTSRTAQAGALMEPLTVTR